MLDRILGARRTAISQPMGPRLMPMRALSGVHVDEDTALAYSAVWSAVKTISETVAMLPWRAYREHNGQREIMAGSPLDVVLHARPNVYMTPFTFREYLVACALLHGNGYAEIVRSESGDVASLYPLHPSSVTLRLQGGEIYYEVRSDNGALITDLLPSDVLHLKGPTLDGMTGRSVIETACQSWGLGIAAEQFSSAFFGNGGVPSYVITQSGELELSKEGADNMLESFERRHRGPSKAGKPALLEAGFDLKPIGIPQKDAQFLESRKFQVSDVARWFRLPPHKLADLDRATFSNIEEQNIEFVTDSIQPWATRLEQEVDVKLALDPSVTSRMDLSDMLRGNSAARAEYYTKMRDLGAFSINDILRHEGQNDIGTDGDLRLVPLNMVSLERARQGGGTDRQSGLRAVVVDILERMTAKERMAATTADKRGHTLEQWGESFFEQQERQIVDALLPAANAVAAAVDLEDTGRVARIVSAAAREHVAKSIQDVARGEWSWHRRAENETDRLLGQLVGASHA